MPEARRAPRSGLAVDIRTAEGRESSKVLRWSRARGLQLQVSVSEAGWSGRRTAAPGECE